MPRGLAPPRARIRRASSDSGFSQNTCLPASSAAMICAACSEVGVTRNTASTSGSREQLRVVAVAARDAERVARPGELLVDRAARGDERGARHALREILGVAAAQPAEAGDADAQPIAVVVRRVTIDLAQSFDDASLAPRRRRRVGQLQRLHAVGDRRAHRLAAGDARRRNAPSPSAYAAR